MLGIIPSIGESLALLNSKPKRNAEINHQVVLTREIPVYGNLLTHTHILDADLIILATSNLAVSTHPQLEVALMEHELIKAPSLYQCGVYQYTFYWLT